MLKIKEIEAKTSPKKKQIELKNISVENLKLVDTDTGEDKKILSLLADFNGAAIELVAKVKDEEELDEPTSNKE